MTYREDDAALLARRTQLARSETGDRDAIDRAIAEIDAMRLDAAKKRLPQIARARVASPCVERWDTMLGDGPVRECSRCEKTVFDLSLMTLGQAEALIAEQGDRCVRIHRRADGTMMFADCEIGARGVVKRVGIAIGAFGVGLAIGVWTAEPAPPNAHEFPPQASSAEARWAADAFLSGSWPSGVGIAQGALAYEPGVAVHATVVGADDPAFDVRALERVVRIDALRAGSFPLNARVVVRVVVEPSGKLSGIEIVDDGVRGRFVTELARGLHAARLPARPSRSVRCDVALDAVSDE